MLMFTLFFNCKQQKETAKVTETSVKVKKAPFVWEAANIYFLLTDRFNNGDTSNDVNFDRTKKTGVNRGFEGGDIKGITQKIKEGYFTKLGVNAIWLSPIFEQIHGGTDESTGFSYGFHGYWTKDWTNLDPNFGTEADLKELIAVAHENDIKILLDAVVNHTGPVTEKDPVWSNDWVRTEPQCVYKDYETFVSCTLVKNLPDVLTNSNEEVELPKELVQKWESEGRLAQEQKELDAFFAATGYPKAPRFYIMKWLADYVAEYGIDGYRVDTVKHVEESVWKEFRKICDDAFSTFKKANPANTLEDHFYLTGEVYGYGINGGRFYDYGDKKVDYFNNGFTSLINFDFKWTAKEWDIEKLFATYSDKIHGDLKGASVLNYISSHDDGHPFDAKREHTYDAGTKLLLAPGASQIYYGDETGRVLTNDKAVGDAKLRSFMNWEDVNNDDTKALLTHFQKLGMFRKNHPSVGAGVHKMLTQSPYTFKRTYTSGDFKDEVMIGLNLSEGVKELEVATVFKDGTIVNDAYSNQKATVTNGKITINSPYNIVLLEQ